MVFVSAVAMDWVLAGEQDRRLPAQHSFALRSRERFLPALARFPTGLYVRILSFGLGNSRRSADRKAGLCMPEAAPSARRNGYRGRLRLGSAGPPYGAQLRCSCEGLQYFPRADSLCAATRRRRGPE